MNFFQNTVYTKRTSRFRRCSSLNIPLSAKGSSQESNRFLKVLLLILVSFSLPNVALADSAIQQDQDTSRALILEAERS